MNYTDKEIERAKALFARDMRKGKPKRMAVAAVALSSRAGRVSHVSHERSWRDYLPKARRELRQELSGQN